MASGWPRLGENATAIANRSAALDAPPARLARVAPWLGAAMGLAWEGGGGEAGAACTERVPTAYDDEEEAMVAERLRALGYLE